MHKVGKYWKWPEQEDHIFYYRSDVIKKIDAPTIAGSRGQFMF